MQRRLGGCAQRSASTVAVMSMTMADLILGLFRHVERSPFKKVCLLETWRLTLACQCSVQQLQGLQPHGLHRHPPLQAQALPHPQTFVRSFFIAISFIAPSERIAI